MQLPPQDEPTVLAHPGAGRGDRGDDAARRDELHRALELHLEAARTAEIPPGDLCVKIARCHDAIGAPDEAFRWVARVPRAADAFRTWSAASTLLGHLRGQARPESKVSCRVGLTGSYTTSQLAQMLPLAALARGIDMQIHEGRYDQYQQDLIDPGSSLYGSEPDQIVLAVHEGALRLPAHSDSPLADLRGEVERWTQLWEGAREHSGAAIVQHNFAVRPEVPLGHLSVGEPGSRYSMVSELNRQLARSAGADVHIVDCDRLAAEFGRDRWFDDRYWFRSKQAVALEALPALARHTAAVVGGQLGLTRKCLVLDLDNTLWGGEVGEAGVGGIVLGGSEAGEAFAAFQEYILQLKERGVILAVASKNNEADAREVFERHPDMRLTLDDISLFAVNWEDKPANLRRIAEALDIGLDAMVLIDDNPAERQLVRQELPEVDVLPFPADPSGYRRTLSQYLGFESIAITHEDRNRTAQYRARAAAAELSATATDIGSFYRDLQMKAVIASSDELHLPRIAQLVAKTNQFNVTTRRHAPSDLEAFMQSPSHLFRYLKLSDRFADHGLVAVLIADVAVHTAEIDTLLMSCRVIGRTVEASLLMDLSRQAEAAGCRYLRGTYVPTPKNQVVEGLFERFGFRRLEGEANGTTRWQYDLAEQGPIVNEFIEVSKQE